MAAKFTATVLVTASLLLPIAATAPAAIAETPSTGSSSGSGRTVNNLICSIRSYLGMGGCVYLP